MAERPPERKRVPLILQIGAMIHERCWVAGVMVGCGCGECALECYRQEESRRKLKNICRVDRCNGSPKPPRANEVKRRGAEHAEEDTEEE